MEVSWPACACYLSIMHMFTPRNVDLKVHSSTVSVEPEMHACLMTPLLPAHLCMYIVHDLWSYKDTKKKTLSCLQSLEFESF